MEANIFGGPTELDRQIAKAGGMCLDEHDGYRCSMPSNHDGNHVAHGVFEYTLAEWPKTVVKGS